MARERHIRQENPDKVDFRCIRRASSQWRILDACDLRECGLNREAVRVRVANGRLHPLYRGVYAWGDPHLPLEACFLAAVKACGPRAVLSHYSAACLWCLLRWDFRDPEVTAHNARRHDGIRTHKSQNIERTFHKGIPVTPPLRTLIDLSSMLPYASLRRAVNEALNQRLVKPHELVTQNHRGARQLRQVVASGAPTRNEFEDLVLSLIGELPKPLVNEPLLGYVPDFCWPEHRVILEADGRETHDQLLARADDKARQRHLEQNGYHVLRVTWRQATTQPQKLHALLRGSLKHRT
jgi:very-short-patch-repair endonuclease